MRIPSSALAIVALALSASTLAGQGSAYDVTRAVRPESYRAHLAFLSSDALEGRAPATRGGRLAADYIATQFARLGLEPAGDAGTWFQRIPIVTHTPAPEAELVAPARRTLRYREDYVLWSQRDTVDVEVSAPVVFAGYGITAPEWNWDDFAGADVRGKIIVVLVNDPGLQNAAIFRGSELTYYGRWTYKIEEAERRGAAGILVVHDTEAATYPWSTVVGSWAKTQARLARPDSPLLVAGWLSGDATRALFSAAGKDLAALAAEAARSGFRAVPLGTTMRLRVRSALVHSETSNVIGRLPGNGPLASEAVIVGGHYDHLGIGEPVLGDSIYNGAEDNASGTAGVIALAEAFAAARARPSRSVLFMAFGAEESGLIGSGAFVERPTLPLRQVAAVLNLDGVNVRGRTRDISALGLEHSTLGEDFAQAAAAEGLRVADDPNARLKGSFFRSDHFPFAKAGVPALSLRSGLDFADRPAGWGQQEDERYSAERYHRPQDEYVPTFDVTGAAQQLRVIARVALLAAGTVAQPRWNATSEFAGAGAARLRAPAP